MLDDRLTETIRERIATFGLILLIPHGRSGSMLMQSLFDGHPQVISFPYWFKQATWRRDAGDTREQLADRFCAQTSLFGGAALQMASNRDKQPSIDIEAFKRELLTVLAAVPDVDDRSLLVCAHLALARLLGRDLAQLKYILVHVHHYAQVDVAALRAAFPRTYFIAMHRDPREEWVSYCRGYHWEYGVQDLLDKLLEFIEYRFVSWHEPFLEFYRSLPAGHVRIVDLNRLHALQEDAMRRLASWLGLDWSDELTRSEFLGTPWAGNSFTGNPVYGFDASRARYTWPERLPSRDVTLLNYFFFPLLEAFGGSLPDRRPSRASVRRLLWLSRPGLFFPRRTSLFLTDREKLDRAYRIDRGSAPSRGSADYRIYVARYLFAFFRRSVRELVNRYNLRRLRRLEALANEYAGVRLSDSMI